MKPIIMRSIPLCVSLCALMIASASAQRPQGAPVYGLMHQPFTGERFFGDGAGSSFRHRNGERSLKTRRCGALMVTRASPVVID